ncbi:MAG: hypothetical protein QNK37_22250 [Acidobacteriota bacterium]|nr:hypothetical protein [Acidobacteriota bacterium]
MRCAFLLLALAVLPAQAQPQLKRGSELRLIIPESLLTEEKVNRKLYSGLTLSLVFRYELSKSASGLEGVTLVEVRYEPWDEVFYLRVILEGREVQSLVHKDFKALARWFQEPGIPLAVDPDTVIPKDRGFRLQVTIHPFSALEQERARRWVAVSQRPAGGASPAAPSQRPSGQPTLAGFLLAGSIKRSAMLSYSWTLDIP